MSTQWQRLGNYELRERLGDGGQGEVWKAFHVLLHYFVAIKVLHTRLTDEDMKQFYTEARTIASLRHPSIMPMLDCGVDSGENTPYLVMHYAPDGSLRTRHPKGSQVPLATVIQYLKELAPALQYAHDHDILHRDIKPENMLIAPEGWGGGLLLSDFGITQLSQTDRTSLQGSTNAEGTPYYMAPEQFLGKSVRASDQYALATVVYEWLSGTVPFSEGDRIEPSSQHLHELVPSLRTLVPTLSTSVEQAVMKALARQPEDRFPSIEAFVEALLTTDVFISYARRDQNLCDQLENHLSHLKYRGLITTWTAREISAGEEIIQQTDMHLNTAHLILLLISANFLASKSCYSRDMMQVIQRHERNEAHVIPVLLRPVVFIDMPFAKLRVLPTNGKPVVNWRNRDSAFVDIVLGIERVVQERRARPDMPLTSKPIAVGVSPHREPGSSRGLILVGLSLLGLVSAGLLLVQHPSLIPLVGVIAGSLILLVGIFLAIRAFVKRAQPRTARRRERERAYYEKALTVYEQVLRQNNADARAYQGKGNALVGLERYSEALTAFKQAVVLTPLPAIYVSMGDVFALLGRHDEAVVAYEQALALDASYASAYAGMGKALLQLGRTQEAEQAYQQAKELFTACEEVLL